MKSVGGPGFLAEKTIRFSLLRAAQSLLFEKGSLKQARVCWCHRNITSATGALQVYRQGDGGGARLSGVTTCGSVWACPVCASRVTEQRRRELSRALVAWHKVGGSAYLLTLTFPHQAGELELIQALERFAEALKRFKNSRVYKAISKRHGRAGSIRSFEVTHGENGWHPHVHELIFAGPSLADDAGAVDQLKGAWIAALERAGLANNEKLGDMWARSLQLQDGRHAAEYIAKFGRESRWGMSSEMTKPHAKIGMRKLHGVDAHYTPFQLLLWAMNGDGGAAGLFTEYAQAFEGKRMLTWSPGLKKRLNVPDLTDEEIAAEKMPDEIWAGELTAQQFGVIVSRNKLGEFLAFVAQCCDDPQTAQVEIDAWCSDISELPKTHQAIARRSSRLAPGEDSHIILDGTPPAPVEFSGAW